MNAGMEFAHKFARAYAAACKPLCRELKLPQTAFDILMFLANNPGYRTAGDIVEVRRIKANLVSVNVDKLVREGYLRRETVEGDVVNALLDDEWDEYVAAHPEAAQAEVPAAKPGELDEDAAAEAAEAARAAVAAEEAGESAAPDDSSKTETSE